MAISATVAEGLDQYSVGPKLRALRTMKKLRLVDLAARTSLSAGLISKIERGLMYPTLPNLLRLALALGVGLEHFFTENYPTVSVVRATDRQRVLRATGDDGMSYHFESLGTTGKDSSLCAYLACFDTSPLDDVKLHTHKGTEFLFVLEGRLGLYVDSEEITLNGGDAAYFDASRMHGYRRLGPEPCWALSVVSRDAAKAA